MYKTASRNLSRVSLNTVMGRGGGTKGPPAFTPNQSARLTEAKRLARIRRIFQLEGRIAAASAEGKSTANLKAELAGVRNGSVRVPLGLARDPKPRKGTNSGATAARRHGAERSDRAPGPSARRHPVSVKAIEADLADLAKGKITLSGVAVVKTLLETFSPSDIADILHAPEKAISKVAESSLLTIAPPLDSETGMALVGVLEARLQVMYPDDAPVGGEPCDDPDGAGPLAAPR